MNGNSPQGAEIKIPLVMLQNCTLRFDTLPSGDRMLVIGPLVLALPLSDENERWFKEQLSGVKIVMPGNVPMPPPQP